MWVRNFHTDLGTLVTTRYCLCVIWDRGTCEEACRISSIRTLSLTVTQCKASVLLLLQTVWRCMIFINMGKHLNKCSFNTWSNANPENTCENHSMLNFLLLQWKLFAVQTAASWFRLWCGRWSLKPQTYHVLQGSPFWFLSCLPLS